MSVQLLLRSWKAEGTFCFSCLAKDRQGLSLNSLDDEVSQLRSSLSLRGLAGLTARFSSLMVVSLVTMISPDLVWIFVAGTRSPTKLDCNLPPLVIDVDMRGMVR